MRRTLSALGGFLRGFLGLVPLDRDRAGVRRALEQRAAGRNGCC